MTYSIMDCTGIFFSFFFKSRKWPPCKQWKRNGPFGNKKRDNNTYITWSYIKQLQTDTMVSRMKCDPRNYVRKICKTYIISSWRCNIFLFSYIILQNVKVKRKIFVRVKFVFLGNTWNNYFKCSVDPLFTSTLGIRKRKILSLFHFFRETKKAMEKQNKSRAKIDQKYTNIQSLVDL